MSRSSKRSAKRTSHRKASSLSKAAIVGKRSLPVARPTEELTVPSDQQLYRVGIPIAIAVLSVILYAYWPTLVWIESAWRNEPDYSHGYLVLPLALLLCVNRWDRMPGISLKVDSRGLSLVALAIVMRVVGRFAYADFFDAWSLPILLAGGVWFLFGRSAMRWSLPPIGFLFFMMPLPFQAESLLSWKLQGIATELSTILLRVAGQPAVSEGHIIWIGDQQLMVEEACSGMRIFIGVAALAYFWAAMVRRSWVDRVVLALAVIPLAVLVNAVRITLVGLFYTFFDSQAAQQKIHDFSGYLMIPTAFLCLWLIRWYWERLYRPVMLLTAKDFISDGEPAV